VAVEVVYKQANKKPSHTRLRHIVWKPLSQRSQTSNLSSGWGERQFSHRMQFMHRHPRSSESRGVNLNPGKML